MGFTVTQLDLLYQHGGWQEILVPILISYKSTLVPVIFGINSTYQICHIHAVSSITFHRHLIATTTD